MACSYGCCAPRVSLWLLCTLLSPGAHGPWTAVAMPSDRQARTGKAKQLQCTTWTATLTCRSLAEGVRMAKDVRLQCYAHNCRTEPTGRGQLRPMLCAFRPVFY